MHHKRHDVTGQKPGRCHQRPLQEGKGQRAKGNQCQEHKGRGRTDHVIEHMRRENGGKGRGGAGKCKNTGDIARRTADFVADLFIRLFAVSVGRRIGGFGRDQARFTAQIFASGKKDGRKQGC